MGAQPQVPSITGTELQERLAKGDQLVMIDVREPDEYQEGHIRGARLLPLGSLPERVDEVPKETTLVLVCRSGGRSGQACEYLQRLGYSNLLNLDGGMLAWTGHVER